MKYCFGVWRWPVFVSQVEGLIRDRKLNISSPEEIHTQVDGNGLVALVLYCLMQGGRKQDPQFSVASMLWLFSAE